MIYNSIISTQVRDENDYLDEWVRYHLSIGFDHIVIYDNESIIPVKNLWGKYVTVLTEKREFQGSPIYNCHNDTVRNFETNWIARIDIDEFIVLKQYKNINELLEGYKDFGGLGINWRIFGTSGHKTKPKGLVKDNYTWRIPDNCGIANGGNFHVKTIIRREYCIQVHHPHFCLSTQPLVNEDYQSYPDAWTDSSRKLAVINHYVTKSVEEWQFKYNLWRYKYDIRTMETLTEIDNNCIIYDDTLKSDNMEIGKTWEWASHQPLIIGTLNLYKPQYVLELGIGENSTPLFSGLNYLGIENNKEWIEKMEKITVMNFVWHDLDHEQMPLAIYYNTIPIGKEQPRLLFVDNYETCRMIAINTLRDKFDLILFHDCEPEPGARINHYEMINSEGFNVYFLKTSANWTGIMIKAECDLGFDKLLQFVNPEINKFKNHHPEMKSMRLANKYEE